MNESRLKSSILLRMFFIAGLSLALVIPAMFVESLVVERQERRDSVTREISQSWGSSQTLTGPIVSIPFKKFSKDEKGTVTSFVEYAHFLPSKLSIRSALKPEVRYRGIYEVVLYNGEFMFEGDFLPFEFSLMGIAAEHIL